MKKVICIGVLIMMALTLTTAQADFYVVGAPGRVGTQITSLPYTISSAGFYYLAKDLSVTGGGITVEADNVTIDLMGFCITGAGVGTAGHGIELAGTRANVEIRNGSITNFGGAGVYAPSTSNNIRVLGLRVNNSAYGINLNGKNDSVLNCSVFANAQTGIHVKNGSLVKGNHVYNNGGNGIGTDWCNMVINNVVQDNYHGIVVSSGSSVMDNMVYSNSHYGIYGFSYNNIARNTVVGSGDEGINVGNYCTIIGNGTDVLVNGTNCTVVNNTVY